jgi:hypothetical protein
MGVVVELCSMKSAGVERNGADFSIGALNGENASNGIVRSVSLYYEWSVRYPMSENRSGGEGVLEALKGGATVVGEDPRSTLVGETG